MQSEFIKKILRLGSFGKRIYIFVDLLFIIITISRHNIFLLSIYIIDIRKVQQFINIIDIINETKKYIHHILNCMCVI